MRQIRIWWRKFYDVRPGESLRTLFMFCYLLLVLFAYYILKPVSRAMFLNRFDIDDLPYLVILVAIGGGILAFLYSKLAIRTSLSVAVFWSMALSVLSLVIMWWLIGMQLPWMIYVLNVWVGLFSIALVSQGWLVASNLFTAREAKRLYGLLGMGLVLGAAMGGEFTKRMAVVLGTHNLLLASAVLVILAYVAFRLAAAQKPGALTRAKGAEGHEADFSLRDVIADIGRHRHLQVIIGIMMVMFVVDTLVDFQFMAMAKQAYRGDQLTAFLGRFYVLYLNATEIVFQLFLTTFIVGTFGVGGTMQIMPISILVASLGTVFAPRLLTTAIVRLTEASTRYTLNKTGMELLYLPLPQELRNRIKAFIDIFFDRATRGIGGLLLVLFTSVLNFQVWHIAVVVMVCTIPWIVLSVRARREYVGTIRKRLASRRLDLESERITIKDKETVRVLEEAAASPNARQAVYALSLMAEIPGYELTGQLRALANSPHAEVRAKIYALAEDLQFGELAERAQQEIHSPDHNQPAIGPAVSYVLSTSTDRMRLSNEFLGSSNPLIVQGVLHALSSRPDEARELITREWITEAAGSSEAGQRALAAQAIGVRGDQGTEALYHLLNDRETSVATVACRAAGALRNRGYLYPLVQHLANGRLRAVAIESLALYGPQICGTLGDILMDETVPVRVRRHIPRVLKMIVHQRSVDVLIPAIGHPDLTVRASVLKGLNSLRERAPQLRFEDGLVTAQFLKEVRYYFELSAALEPFRSASNGRGATRLLVGTLEARLAKTLERLFRLLGLRYPGKEIYSAYLAVSRKHTEEAVAAIEFLDNVVERDLKRFLLPLLDAPEHVTERGRDLFGVLVLNPESAVRELIRSRDPWLVSCAIATAVELRMRALVSEIRQAARGAEGDVLEVAQAAERVLA
jgi:ATP/ADP translocase/HEAT repeat protein